jgi:hypothetical protein
MAHVITFRSTRFDIQAETPNPINPIAGKAVLEWLRERLIKSRCETTEPGPEDWGWYMVANLGGASYLVGASGEGEGDSSNGVDWTIQIHKWRSLKEKITGAHKLSNTDTLSALVERIVREDEQAAGIEVAREA